MVFHHKIQQVGGLAFNRGVSRLAENSLVEVAENSRQPIISRMSKQRCRLTARYQPLLKLIQGMHTLFWREQAATGLAGRLIQ